ncbi:MAG: hypothetical protein JWR83_3698 [Aeromicrobium sp.]|nr:hypothetical protein [Aeromicrobium sp.]
MPANTPEATPAGHPLLTDTASWARRVLALVLDWAASSLVAAFILGGFDGRAYQWLPLVIFWLESAVGIALTGASFGQAITRIRVHQLDSRPLPLLRALQRQLLICLVIPPLVFRQDGRGLHDLWTNSAAYAHH